MTSEITKNINDNKKQQQLLLGISLNASIAIIANEKKGCIKKFKKLRSRAHPSNPVGQNNCLFV
jgi:hypothetical protein